MGKVAGIRRGGAEDMEAFVSGHLECDVADFDFIIRKFFPNFTIKDAPSSA